MHPAQLTCAQEVETKKDNTKPEHWPIDTYPSILAGLEISLLRPFGIGIAIEIEIVDHPSARTWYQAAEHRGHAVEVLFAVLASPAAIFNGVA